jgi:hypothetical protein
MKTMIQGWDRQSNEPGLKQLAKKCMEQQRRKTPSVPDHAIPKKVFRDQRANDLTQSIITFFGVIGGMAERVNSMGRQIKRNGTTVWINGTGTNGTADVSATFQGKSIKVEVKVGKDRQSEVQKAYQKRIKQAGGIYIIARSFDGFLHEFFRAVEGLNNVRG